MEHVATATEEELFLLLLPYFRNFLLDFAILVFLKGKLAFCKTITKALLKPHIELVALVIL